MRAKYRSSATQEVARRCKSTKEEGEWKSDEGQAQLERDGEDLDPEQVSQGQEEEENCMVKTLEIFGFGSWEDATSKASKLPTTTEWVGRVQKDDGGREFARCRLVARVFKPRREGPRDDLFAAMPPLESEKALFAYITGASEMWRQRGQPEAKRTSKKKNGLSCRANLRIWRYARLKRWLYGMREVAPG